MGRPRRTDLRRVFDAIQYMLASGCQWRLIPPCYPPFSTVQNYFYAWSRGGVLERMLDALREQARRLSGRLARPTAAAGLALHYHRSPDLISAQEVQEYLIHLHDERGLSWQSCNCVRHGIRFLYRITLGRPDPHFYIPGAKTPSRLPEILNHDELVRLFTVTTNIKHLAVLMTAYAAGLRVSEIRHLQVTDIDSVRMCLRIDQGKGNKDRYVPLSQRLLAQLRHYWRYHRPPCLRTSSSGALRQKPGTSAYSSAPSSPRHAW